MDAESGKRWENLFENLIESGHMPGVPELRGLMLVIFRLGLPAPSFVAPHRFSDTFSEELACDTPCVAWKVARERIHCFILQYSVTHERYTLLKFAMEPTEEPVQTELKFVRVQTTERVLKELAQWVVEVFPEAAEKARQNIMQKLEAAEGRP